MEPVSQFTKEQYELVLESRKVLIEYCKTISPEDFLYENSNFGRGGSIRNLLTHIANTYKFWISEHGLKKPIVFTPNESVQNIIDTIDLFDKIDMIIFEFIDLVGKMEKKHIEYEIDGIKSSTTPLRLFTHVITHEFHHKGQILSMSRYLGYTPVDTDIII